jgi:hypothetical protein
MEAMSRTVNRAVHRDADGVCFDAMRTTISIEDHLLRAAKQRALERGMTLGGLIEDALRVVLTAGVNDAERAALPVSKRHGGARPGIDVGDGVRLRDLMDEV